MGNKTMKPSSTSASASDLVESAIASHPVVIFSKTYCPYCTKAKTSISRAGASVASFTPPKVYELNRMGALGAQVQAYLAEKTSRRTVPNVFIGGRSVGGGDETAQFERSGVLKQMLTQAPDRLAELHPAPQSPEPKPEPALAPPAPQPAPQPAPPAPQQLVEDAVRNNPVVVFSKSFCPYCVAAKDNIAAAAQHVPAFDATKTFELDHMGEEGSQIQAYLAEKTGRTTVPSVFIAGQFVGGSDDVAALAASNELVTRIAEAVKSPADQPGPPQRPAEKLVEEAIAANHVVMFSKTYCGFCHRAKATLQEAARGLDTAPPPKVFEVDEMGALGEDVQQYLFEKTGQRTVPNIYIARNHIGGSDDLSSFSESGALKQALHPAPVQLTRSGSDGPILKTIVLGAGCFWGVELAFQRVVGVVDTEVGYSNGKFGSVSYEAVCSGMTGSAEVVRVTYDERQISVTQLLEVWESRHDPTSLNKQGNDTGTQYRSGVYFYDEDQMVEINEWSADARRRLSKPVATEIAKVQNYCKAEGYHQQYLERKGQSAKKGALTKIRCYG